MPFIVFLSVFISLTFSTESVDASISPQQIDQRIHAHLILADYQTACSEAFLGIQQYPQSKLLWLAFLRAISKAGDEKKMWLWWKAFLEKFPEEGGNREVLEWLAWAVIDKGVSSSSPTIRATAMLGAFFSQDAKGVAILRQGLCDDNSFLRAAAVKLSSHLADASLQDRLVDLLETEKVWKVRLEVIRAIGKLGIAEAKEGLKKLIAYDLCHVEEKAAAIKALVSLCEGIEPQQISQLISCNRAGMRMLACELVAFFDQIEDIGLIFPLIDDPHPDVRGKMLQTIGRLRNCKIAEKSAVELAKKGIYDSDPMVAMTAAWVLTINDPEQGIPIFERFLNHAHRETRYLAAAALAATGKYGLNLTKKIFYSHRDIYVKMNLAIGLIGQRVDIKEAGDCLFLGLSTQKERWEWNEDKGFRMLVPSKIKHEEAIPNYPEAVNQLTRLEVLELLSMIQYPHAQQAIKNFLKESQWGVSGLASALLLTEGDDEAIELVKNLINENDPKIKVQAALILALWSNGEDVVQLLQEAYPEASRELKVQILEGLGRVGAGNSLLFLAEKLQEPYQTLRLTAAAALLECLYH